MALALQNHTYLVIDHYGKAPGVASQYFHVETRYPPIQNSTWHERDSRYDLSLFSFQDPSLTLATKATIWF